MSLTMQPSESATEVHAGSLIRITAPPGKPGDPGPPGRHLTAAEVNSDGELVFTFSDKEVVNVGRVVGLKGAAGRGLASGAVVGDDLVLRWTDDTEQTVGRVVGLKGDAGRGVADAEISLKGDLVLILTDGSRIEVGRVKGRPGDSVKGDPGDNGVSIKSIRLDDDGTFVATYSNDREEVVGRIALPKDGRSVASAEVNADGKLVMSFSDGAPVTAGHVAGGKGDPGRGITGTRLTEEGDLAVAYTDGREDIVGHVVGPQPDDGVDGRSIDDVEINAEGHLVLKFSDKSEKDVGKVVGEDGKTPVATSGPRGRVLVGSIGRLTADRRPPGATNTYNIPADFCRAITLLISDGIGSGARIEGLHSSAAGVVSWQEWARVGAAEVVVEADQENCGLAVTAPTTGSWTCRMIGAPE